MGNTGTSTAKHHTQWLHPCHPRTGERTAEQSRLHPGLAKSSVTAFPLWERKTVTAPGGQRFQRLGVCRGAWLWRFTGFVFVLKCSLSQRSRSRFLLPLGWTGHWDTGSDSGLRFFFRWPEYHGPASLGWRNTAAENRSCMLLSGKWSTGLLVSYMWLCQ